MQSLVRVAQKQPPECLPRGKGEITRPGTDCKVVRDPDDDGRTVA